MQWENDAKQFLLSSQCLSTIEGGFREVKNVIARAALYASIKGAKVITKEMVQKALEQNIQPVTAPPPTAATTAARSQTSESDARSKVTKWLADKGIATEKLNYKTLLVTIPTNHYQAFLDFMSQEFTGNLKDSSGFLAVMSEGLKKQVKANTVRSAFTNKLKTTAK